MTLVAVLYGVVAILIFRRLTDAASIRGSVNRVLAHVMELGLFLDSPRLVLRAQANLLRENLRLLRQVLVPGVVLGTLFLCVNAIAGHAPLPTGESAVVTVQMKDPVMPAVQLEPSPWLAVETPGVRALRDHQISWRVRLLRPAAGDFKFRVDNRVVTAGLFVRDPAIQSIAIPYPPATMFGHFWIVPFMLISCVSALVFGLCWKR